MEIMPLDENKKIIEEVEYNDRVVSKMKYGLIKIMGEDCQREVTWNTYQYLKKLPASFKGTIEIQELKLTIPVHQIIKLEEKEAETVKFKNFTKLPTETIMLDKNFNILHGTRLDIEKENDMYYLATCHYIVDKGEKQYYLEPHQIRHLVMMVKDENNLDYQHLVASVQRYGIKK